MKVTAYAANMTSARKNTIISFLERRRSYRTLQLSKGVMCRPNLFAAEVICNCIVLYIRVAGVIWILSCVSLFFVLLFAFRELGAPLLASRALEVELVACCSISSLLVLVVGVSLINTLHAALHLH